MRLRDRRELGDDLTHRALEAADGGGDSNSGELRADGEAFLAAADEAITRALSGNSEEFLLQNRQMGGQ